MHPKDPTPNAQKTYIIYHLICPSHNCTAEYIGEINTSLKERKSIESIEIKPQVPSDLHHISTNNSQAELKNFIIIDRGSNTLHHQANEALHMCIKDSSLNRNVNEVRIPSIFNKHLKPYTQLEQPHSSIPPPRGHLLYLVYQHKRQITLHTFLISIYNSCVTHMFTLFKLQDNWIFRPQPWMKYIWKTIFTQHKVSSSSKRI